VYETRYDGTSVQGAVENGVSVNRLLRASTESRCPNRKW